MLFISLVTATAWPCAGLFHEEGALAESDVQEAILEQTAEGVRVSYLAQYDGDAAEFGWIIPIFGEFQAIEDGDADRFTALREHTSPSVYYSYAKDEPTCGCGASKGDNALGDDTAGGRQGFDIVAEGFTGTFEYTVIEGTSSQAILDWLTQNGWQVSASEAAIDAYVSEGGVQFIALSLALQTGETPEEGRQLPSVVIDYAGDSMRFPSTMGRYGDVDELRTTVWVIGDQVASGGGWSQASIGNIDGGIDEEPEDVWAAALREIGGMNAVFNLTWAGSFETGYLTRFDTLAHKDAHTIDATFALDAGTDSVSTEIWLYEESAAAGLLMLPLALLGAGLRRRRQGL